jgi:CRP-like cAMP-binding protein
VDLVLGEALCRPGELLKQVYFPTEGFISLVTDTDGHPGLEVGMIGREGMLGAHIALGVSRVPLHAVVQGAGKTWRVDAKAFKAALSDSPALKRAVDRYIYVLMAQIASSAACLRFHLITPRLARWLLMSQDRAHSDSFRMTQEFLAYMLGVRRVGVTASARTLEHAGLIEYSRGNMRVLDRNGLEAAACSCYASDSAVYSLELGAKRPKIVHRLVDACSQHPVLAVAG